MLQELQEQAIQLQQQIKPFLPYRAEAYASIAAAFGVVGGAFAFIVNVIISWYKARSQKRRETMEFYHSIRNKYLSTFKLIDKKFKESKVTSISYYNLKEDKDTFNAINEYLYILDIFSIGLNNGIYDIKVFKKTIGGLEAVMWYWRLKYIIEKYREKDKRLYKEYEKVVSKIETKRKKIARAYNRLKDIVDRLKRKLTHKQYSLELRMDESEIKNPKSIVFNYTKEERDIIRNFCNENKNIFTDV